MKRCNRRTFIKWGLGGALGAALIWLGAMRAEDEDSTQEKDEARPVPQLQLDPPVFLCTPHLNYRPAIFGEYWDRPTSEILGILERLEAIAKLARQRLDEPWEAPIYTQVVRSPPVDARSGQPCPAIESSLVMGVGRRSAQIFTEPWGMEVKLGD